MIVLLNIFFILIGAAAVLWGADRFTDGSASLARRMNVPPMVVGLTVVGFGTSAPELFVSMVSALEGSSGISIGNVVGSNIFNVLLIIGVCAAITPMQVSKSAVRKDMPWAVGAALLLLALCLDKYISRWDGMILLAGFAAFITYTLLMARKSPEAEGEVEIKSYGWWGCAGLILLGLVCLVVGSNLFVRGASEIARILGVSDAVVGLTIVAGGTSLPELATSVVAARKGQSALALGNVIGSNVFNVLLILGLAGTICPMSSAEITALDMGVFTGSALLFWLFARTGYKLARWEGWTFTVAFTAYMAWLVYNI